MASHVCQTMGTHPENCTGRWFCHCADISEAAALLTTTMCCTGVCSPRVRKTISFGAGMMQMITKQLAPHFMSSYSFNFFYGGCDLFSCLSVKCSISFNFT